MELKITPFRNSHEYAMEIREFEPPGGYEVFLKRFCQFTGGEFLDWAQDWWNGIGHIKLNKQKLTVCWRDFPLAISFDCDTREQAEEIKMIVRRFFEQNSQYHS